ncbi:hypothetical protein HD806DRAFT_158633 [Xylariaceae sp. AK1471]|nr:hypothetical protein HD806DRAFT_158633 [Xylariaceae sp. AK1471]
MLLTPSQVSILLTSGIVLLCTSALFISGCLIQQRTLRDLRLAIRPAIVTRPKPRVWDTEALQKTRTTIRLEDGTMVQIQSPDPDPELVITGADDTSRRQEEEIIEVRPTIPETDVEVPVLKPITLSQNRGGKDQDQDDSALKVKGSWDGVQEGGEPLSRVERRKRIKAEIQRLSQGDTPVYYQRRLW